MCLICILLTSSCFASNTTSVYARSIQSHASSAGRQWAGETCSTIWRKCVTMSSAKSVVNWWVQFLEYRICIVHVHDVYFLCVHTLDQAWHNGMTLTNRDIIWYKAYNITTQFSSLTLINWVIRVDFKKFKISLNMEEEGECVQVNSIHITSMHPPNHISPFSAQSIAFSFALVVEWSD